MPKIKEIKKVLVIGSGPIVIGSGAEFDYAGTQACKCLKEEGIEVILINSNPATIMTDEEMAHKVYIQPITIEAIEAIFKKENPDGLLASLGGQVALNMAIQLEDAGLLDKYKVTLLGTPLDAIQKGEDRELFKGVLENLGEPMVPSYPVSSYEEALDKVVHLGFPLVIRPAYTMGGLGGGISYSEEDFEERVNRGLHFSPINQVLIEKSILGYQEIEYEVIRDQMGTAIVVCNMENIDPVGVHTGDSIVVAPSQTLSDDSYHMLRTSALKIVDAIGICGGCNVQFAYNPEDKSYVIIEVNPRVSRSSALASKATGYPIAKITTLIALGYNLHEIINPVTKSSTAAFEPVLDYVVVKLPKLPFDKFINADPSLSTQMQATGEVMALGRSFEHAFLKAVTCLQGESYIKVSSDAQLSLGEIMEQLKKPTSHRIHLIAEALRRGLSKETIESATRIHGWYIHKLECIIAMEKKLLTPRDNQVIEEAEAMGFTEEDILSLTGLNQGELDTLRRVKGIYPVYKMVDTCSAEFPSSTPYLYSSYDEFDEDLPKMGDKIIIVGSGPIRIGQGIEFDYASVHGAWAAKQMGYQAIMVNNNPETVSTDFDIADKLYFEPLMEEDLIHIIRREMPRGVVLQLGGQTAINLAESLMKKGVQILGTSVESMNIAENREKCDALLNMLNIPHPIGQCGYNKEQVLKKSKVLSYPILIRPSFVIGGQSMAIIYSEEELQYYLEENTIDESSYPLLMDSYVEGIEVEVDLISDGKDILIPGLMEHIEPTGVHSGDSFAVYPQRRLSKKNVKELVSYSGQIASALKVVGLLNIQYVVSGDEIYVIEVNPRASRTVPILSKVTKVPMIQVGLQVMLGEKLKDLHYGTGLLPELSLVAVKAPVFSFHKLKKVDVTLGPEMKSTGEVLGVDDTYEGALCKAFLASGHDLLKDEDAILLSMNHDVIQEHIDLFKSLSKFSIKLYATEGTYKRLRSFGIAATLFKENESDGLLQELKDKKIKVMVNIPSKTWKRSESSQNLREAAIQQKIPCFTCMDTFSAYLEATVYLRKTVSLEYKTMEEYLRTYHTVSSLSSFRHKDCV